MFGKIFDIYKRLDEMHKRPVNPEMTVFCEILLECDRFLGVIAVSKTSAVRRARSLRVPLQFNVLHRKIDELLGMLNVSGIKSSVHRWKLAPIKNYVKQEVKELRNMDTSGASKALDGIRIQRFEGTDPNHKFQRINSFASDPNGEGTVHFPRFIS